MNQEELSPQEYLTELESTIDRLKVKFQKAESRLKSLDNLRKNKDYQDVIEQGFLTEMRDSFGREISRPQPQAHINESYKISFSATYVLETFFTSLQHDFNSLQEQLNNVMDTRDELKREIEDQQTHEQLSGV